MRPARRAAGFALAFLSFELLLRSLGAGGEAVDARTGALPSGGVTIRNRLGEGFAVSHWTGEGVRVVPDAPAEGPPILVLGDSFTQALQVGDREVYTARLQAIMGLPVLNRGCGACSAADYVAAATALRRYRQRWTVIQLNPPDLYGDAFNSGRTHFEVRAGGLHPVVVPRPRPGQSLQALRRSSALIDAAIVRAGMFRRGSKMPPLFLAADEGKLQGPRSVADPEHVEDVLDALAAAYERRVTFLFIPEYIEDRRATWPYVDRRAADVEQRFGAWCAQSGASCANLRASFAAFARRGRAPSGFPNSRFGRGHLNRDGHRAAAEMLARELESVRRRGLF